MTVTFRPGRLPNDPSKPRLSLDDTLAALPAPPAAFNGFAGVASWGMLGNDQWGDCTFACDGHVVEQQTALGLNREKVVTTGQALAAYSACTGFNPNAGPPGENPTDNGFTVQGALDYLRKTGIAGFKVAAFAQVNVGNHTAIRQAVAEFGCLSIGINLPQSAMDQFNAQQAWTPVVGSPNIGGHCVQVVGYDSNWLYVVTWGAVQRMSWSFWMDYVEEAWVPVSADWQSKSGLSLTAFGEEFAAMTGQPNPFPAPSPAPPPAPTPTPTPAPTPVPPAPNYNWLQQLLRAIVGWFMGIFGSFGNG